MQVASKNSMTLVTWMRIQWLQTSQKVESNSINAFSSMISMSSMECCAWIDSINSLCSGASISSMPWAHWKACITWTSPITSQVLEVSQSVALLQLFQLVPLTWTNAISSIVWWTKPINSFTWIKFNAFNLFK